MNVGGYTKVPEHQILSRPDSLINLLGAGTKFALTDA